MLAQLRYRMAHRLERVAKAIAPSPPAGPAELPFSEAVLSAWLRVRERTMTTVERLDALIRAVEHVQRNGVPGSIVECGVWRGGSMMGVALTLMRMGAERDLFLFDTFSGMTPPSPADQDFAGKSAADYLAESDGAGNVWARASLEDVEAGMLETGYPPSRVTYVVGDVLSTIPGRAPESIALCRLDTDWYESTRHELQHLWPRLSKGGILIIDDYGSWAGAKKAVDEYFEEQGLSPYLHRIDIAGRLVIKA